MTTSPYAWVIDHDYLERADHPAAGPEPIGCEGTVGPSTANGATAAELQANYQHRHSFELWDDDRIRNASGTLFWNGDPDSPDDDNDDFVYGPLRDFGGPALGCVRVAYPGRPGWDCG